MFPPRIVLLAAATLLAAPARAGAAPTPAATDSAAFVRVNQVGYLPDAPKVAVVCALRPVPLAAFTVEDERGRVVLGPLAALRDGAFGPCVQTWRLDFGTLRRPGRYRVRAGAWVSGPVRIGADVYQGLADTLMGLMRQQRSGFNPFLGDSAHRQDGIIVDHPTRTGEFIAVSGGWADAADYLQYVTTSATATYHLLAAWRDVPGAFADAHDARGLPGRNGVPDVLDEARHGLAWLVRMYPDDSTMFNQLGDDRDHRWFDLITTDSTDYGWGKGGARPVYPCTGRPQGLLGNVNRSTGDARYLQQALGYARLEPVTPWMGADTARHYQWYPWHNAGHYESFVSASADGRAELAGFYREGLARVTARAGNGFRVGIPFIWCSNDLMVSFATQAMLYRRMTGDARFRAHEQAAVDWLFGANPWGTSMVIGVPRDGRSPRDPHTEMPPELRHGLVGGLVDGPVYASIFRNLRGVALRQPDEYAAFNTGHVVYHDDLGDYATNEHIMDGTASLAYLLATLDPAARPR